MVDSFGGDAKAGFFALYDGHDGRTTVDFVVRHMHTVCLTQLPLHHISHSSHVILAYSVLKRRYRNKRPTRTAKLICPTTLLPSKAPMWLANI
jgi:hypothetical protein